MIINKHVHLGFYAFLTGVEIKLQNKCLNSTEETIIILNVLYTGLFIVTFVISIIVLYLNLKHWRIKVAAEINEGLFMAFSIVITLQSSIESFQWVFLYNGYRNGGIACKILAAFREYSLVTFLSLLLCFGVHLLIIVLQPKWLMVIEEVKRRRQKRLLFSYFVIIFGSPVVFVPWPTITGNYGNGDFICWIADAQCNIGLSNVILDQILLWHGWACVACLFTALVTAFILSVLLRSSGRGNCNIYTILCFLIVFLVLVLLNIACAIAVWTQWSAKYLQYVNAICTPLGIALVGVVNIIRIFWSQQHIQRPRHIIVKGYNTIKLL